MEIECHKLRVNCPFNCFSVRIFQPHANPCLICCLLFLWCPENSNKINISATPTCCREISIMCPIIKSALNGSKTLRGCLKYVYMKEETKYIGQSLLCFLADGASEKRRKANLNLPAQDILLCYPKFHWSSKVCNWPEVRISGVKVRGLELLWWSVSLVHEMFLSAILRTCMLESLEVGGQIMTEQGACFLYILRSCYIYLRLHISPFRLSY